MSDKGNSGGVKVVLLGDSGVGKTCIISRYISNLFEDNVKSTNGASYASKRVDYPKLKKSLILDIWDTAGQEKFKALTKFFYKDAAIVILVYDITRRDSFDNIKNVWYQEVKENGAKDIILGIAGNKSDLYENEEVPETEAREFATSVNAIYALTSAQNNNGIDKLFPKNSSKSDLKFYKKCCRLDFIKPENLIKDKIMINENLWKTSMVLINEMDNKLTPADKIKSFEKAFGILQNSITFSSGKNDLGIDDTVSFLIYIILKSKPKNICSNSKYCQLLLNPDLAKRQYGILLTQLEMVKNIIFDMKYTDLIGITEEEFGKDED